MAETTSSGLMNDETFAELLVDSHDRLLRRSLIDGEKGVWSTAEWLWQAPFCLLATDPTPDARFTYVNAAAQACFGYDLNEFIGLPSRLSAEAPLREERQRLIDAVTRDGFAADVQGVRVTKSGRRFRIEGGTVWSLIDRSGIRHGTAAVFRTWHPVD